MNKTYQLIWNAVQQAWVVSSELGKARKKAKISLVLTTLTTVGSVLLCSSAYADPEARALPSLNNIASGAATLSTATGSLTVNQTSDKLIANWNSFDVGVNSQVNFNQPNSSSIALNRIAGNAPSEIFGRVSANGQLILVNPAGLTLGVTAQVNAASVIASTLDISDANFLADNLQFDRGTSTGTINNQGTILANEGNTYVFASTINNSGTIRAKGGNVNVANGNRLTVNNMAGTATLNQVSGIAGIISSTGILRADRLTTTDKGKIFLIGDRARNGSQISLAGEITSTGNDIKGKTLYVTGDTVVNSNTNINAVNSINIDGALSVSGNNRLISLTYGTIGNDGLLFSETGKINMPGTAIRYRANNTYYTLVKTLAELQAIGDYHARAGKYVLALDIDASSKQFTPIGNSNYTGFSGILDGLGHTINNLIINKPDEDEIGLIGFNNKGSIKNINLSNVNIIGRNCVGGLIGWNGDGVSANNSGVISGNQVSGAIRGQSIVGGLIGRSYGSNQTIITDNSVTANVSGIGGVGGLIGFSSSNIISNNHTTGRIYAQGNAGGLIGTNEYSSISNSYATGNIVTTQNGSNIGGLVGYNDGILSSTTISNSYATGTVKTISSTGSASYVGGLVGYNSKASISNSYATGIVSGNNYVGGLIGSHALGNINNSYASGNVTTGTGSTYTGGLIGINDRGSIYNSYANGDVIAGIGSTYTGGLLGYIYTASYVTSDTIINNNFSAGNVSGGSYVGGLIGSINHHGNATFELNNNYSRGNVTGDNHIGGLIGSSYNDIGKFYITSAYVSGKLVSNEAINTAGLIGSASDGSNASTSVSNSFWNKTVTGINNAIGTSAINGTTTNLTGLTTAETKQQASYTSWDISNLSTGSSSIWYINEGVSAPVLRSLMTP